MVGRTKKEVRLNSDIQTTTQVKYGGLKDPVNRKEVGLDLDIRYQGWKDLVNRKEGGAEF